MKLPVVWTSPALAQLSDVHSYITRSNAVAADSQIGLIVAAAENLAEFSEIGRAGRRRGTRELVVPGTSYIAVYRIRLSSVRVLAVMHGARRWPRKFNS
jgi:toxin ParE1/3/4